MRDAQPGTIFLKDYAVPDFLIDTTSLTFNLGERGTLVNSRLVMRRNPLASAQAPLVLDGVELELKRLVVDGVELHSPDYTLTAETLTIADVPDAFELECVTLIKPHENTSLEGLYKSRSMFCTQCEAEGFRKITYYLDRPDVMSEFSTTIIADAKKYPVLLSNGNVVDSGDLEGGKIFVTWHDPFRKPCYLFALVAGNLAFIQDHFITSSGREVALRIYVESKDIDKCDHAMASLKHAMQWDEDVYGREYDLDIFMIVAVDDFNMGAMENKGLNIFNTSCVLARPETTTDAGYERVEAVVAHEYFHNWSGNRVTCRDWFQLSLKEGFTVFRDAEFSADMGLRTVKRIEDVALLRTAQFAEDAGPMAHPVQPASYMEISNFYTVTIYEKGAEVVRMLHTLLGPDLFRKGSDIYFARHDGQAVTIEEFVCAMEQASGRDFAQFRRWYTQAGTPRLEVTDHYDVNTQLYTLTVKQSCPATPESAQKLPFHIPLAVGLMGDAGALRLVLQGAQPDTETSDNTQLVLEVTEAEQVFVFENVIEKPVPSLLRGFSAPVKLRYPYTTEDLTFLMSRDTDGFNRWDACQQLGLQVLQALIVAHAKGETLEVDTRLIEAYRAVLSDTSLDKAMVAHMLQLPSEAYLAEEAAVIDVDAIHRARQQVRTALAHALRDEFDRLYHENTFNGEYQSSASEVARRSLRNTALAYLMRLPDRVYVQLAAAQFELANNMTDASAALMALINSEQLAAHAAAAHALHAFYDKWHNETLVVNHWLMLQAQCQLPGTLDKVKALMHHAAFDLHNPNKVRALIGAFCNANPVNFHALDGSGYAFLAEQITTLNKLNPQIASRLLTPLTRWKRYPAERQALMRAQLQRIMDSGELSKDVFEVVSKSLV